MRKKDKMSRQTIFNADDFGLSEGVNRGIIKAFSEGVVGSASIMAVGRAYEDAVRQAKANPMLDIGIHLCLTEEKPVLEKEKIRSLVTQDGYFLGTYRFIIKYLLGGVDPSKVEREIEAQIKKILDSGLQITHIDSHDYIHMLPLILEIVIKLAKRHNIAFIRFPYERYISINTGLWRHILQFCLNTTCCFLKDNFANAKIRRTDYFYGFLESGHLTEQHIRHSLKSVAPGITEFVCHPGLYDDILRYYQHWHYHWEQEVEVLTSQGLRNLIRDFGIETTNFRDINA